MGRKDEMFGRLFNRRMDDGKLSLFFWMGVSCCQLVVFRRFGQWTATNPFTPQRFIGVGVWLGVQTGNKRTTREWTRPGNRPTISFWFGEFINGRGFVRNGIELSTFFIHILGDCWVGGRGDKKQQTNIFSNFSQFYLLLSNWVADADPLGIEGRDFLFPAAEMDEEEGEQFPIFDFNFHYSGCGEGKIVIWTPLEKKKTRILSQHSNWAVDIYWLSFSPDGRFLASADLDGKLIIWATEVNKKTERIRREWL